MLNSGDPKQFAIYDGDLSAERRVFISVFFTCATLAAQIFVPPAGLRTARIGASMSILPGGRVITPLGEQHATGARPIALVLSASGKTLVTGNFDLRRPSLTVLEHSKTWETRQLPAAVPATGDAVREDSWRSLGVGLAFSGEHSVWVSEGSTGKICLIDLGTGERRRIIDLNDSGVGASFTGDLAMDGARDVLYAADLGKSRVAVIDGRSRQVLASVAVGGPPAAMALDPDRRKLYVSVKGTAFPKAETSADVIRVLNVTQPAAAKVETTVVLTGLRRDLTAVIATAEHWYVADAEQDSILVIDGRTGRMQNEIPIRVRGLAQFRGILPLGLAYEEKTGWLLAAEAGINAVGVIDTHSNQVLGHLPAGWFPTRVQADRGTVYVANGKGRGAGPNVRADAGLYGSVSIYGLPRAGALAEQTELVMQAAGLVPRPDAGRALPEAIRHVVLIVKGGRAFDEVLGDFTKVSNGPVASAPELARFGRDGYVGGQGQRLSLHHVNVTPNHHAIAAQWTFSDNFYADSETSAEGRHWLSVWSHLARNGITFYNSGASGDRTTPDTARAERTIEEIEERFEGEGRELPQFVMIHLPGDRMGPARPEAGYPYEASYLADNDEALGRLLEYFSRTKWWGQMAVFVTEASAENGFDHIDAHRTLLLCGGPWARRNEVLHTNTSFPGLLKTIFRLLRVPPLNLLDASAADLSECFASSPDETPYRAAPVDPRIYTAAPVRNEAH